jgi:hypothetical protein
MHNITLICTRHHDIGKCNSHELYRIIEDINPEVIFEEMPPSYFGKYYLDKSRSNLESNAINKYKEKYKIEQVPVDSEDMPSKDFFYNYKRVINRIEGLTDINGFTLRNQIDAKKAYSEKYGFEFLNSIYYINLDEEIDNAIENSLRNLNDEELSNAFKLWKEYAEMRENHMLKNIYKYSEENCYERAIFLIGASHRKSIIEKISECQKTQKVKLNWIIKNAST